MNMLSTIMTIFEYSKLVFEWFEILKRTICDMPYRHISSNISNMGLDNGLGQSTGTKHLILLISLLNIHMCVFVLLIRVYYLTCELVW
jgi:hypothetical protein